MNDLLTAEQFYNITKNLKIEGIVKHEYIYEVYSDAFKMVSSLIKEQSGVDTHIDSLSLTSYVLGEYIYSTQGMNEDEIEKFISNENIENSMASVSADKYLSLSLYNHKQVKLTSRYLPPISSISLYVNLMLNFISLNKRNDPKNTLIVDLLNKSLMIARSIINLLVEGYETEAFAVWRTLHECECTLILMDKYQDTAISAYLKHMKYGLAYKDGYQNKQEQESVINTIKEELKEHDLKSKDLKKFIEYGWLYSIPESKSLDNFKLNFRDGLEALAGLHNYAEIYMQSSEILHSTPLLIYSNKQYFYLMTLLNLYESFFRIEKIFQTLFFLAVGEVGKASYLQMRKLYYSQLQNIHLRESEKFKSLYLNRK